METRTLGPLREGAVSFADWGSVLPPRRHTPSTAKAVPRKVNCPEGAREATLGCPLRGGKGTVLTKVDKHFFK